MLAFAGARSTLTVEPVPASDSRWCHRESGEGRARRSAAAPSNEQGAASRVRRRAETHSEWAGSSIVVLSPGDDLAVSAGLELGVFPAGSDELVVGCAHRRAADRPLVVLGLSSPRTATTPA
jgi:hypothetical protein